MSAAAWLAGSTHRWHTNPALCASGDRVDAHSARVAVLILALFPDASANLMRAAILHDLGENWVGDMALPIKRRRPDFVAQLEAAEAEALAAMGLDMPDLSEIDASRLELCDKADSYLWAVHNRPDYVARQPAWARQLDALRTQAKALGVGPEFNLIVLGVRDGKL